MDDRYRYRTLLEIELDRMKRYFTGKNKPMTGKELDCLEDYYNKIKKPVANKKNII